jgi:TRAP-type C4-dicarboxylate transport system permease small subunit
MFATGIFTRDGVLAYLVKIISFLSQLALVIGAGMIIYNGYEYALASFNGKDPGTGRIKNAIYGILIVIFSYAIIQALKSAFL